MGELDPFAADLKAAIQRAHNVSMRSLLNMASIITAAAAAAERPRGSLINRYEGLVGRMDWHASSQQSDSADFSSGRPSLTTWLMEGAPPFGHIGARFVLLEGESTEAVLPSAIGVDLVHASDAGRRVPIGDDADPFSTLRRGNGVLLRVRVTLDEANTGESTSDQQLSVGERLALLTGVVALCAQVQPPEVVRPPAAA